MKKAHTIITAARNLITLAAIGIEILAAVVTAQQPQPSKREPKRLRAPKPPKQK